MHAACRAEFPVEQVLTSCPRCAAASPARESLLDIVYDDRTPDMQRIRQEGFARFLRPEAGAECSGVWQFRELLPFYRSPGEIVSVGEGKTILQRADALATHLGFAPGRLHLQYEGLNPSGSFKDNGMTAGFTHARMVGARAVACASTGNTSASLALYASLGSRADAPMRAFVFIGDGKIAFGKLSQALDYGATTLQIAGDFDACLARVRQIAEDPASGVYLLNSVNPFRLEGQKTIMYRVLRDLGLGRIAGEQAIPDWIVVPGGNLGNCAAFGKAFIELRRLGVIGKVPRLAVINARGARTLDRLFNDLGLRWRPAADDDLAGSWDDSIVDREMARMDAAGEKAHTIASAIEINRPVNLPKALRALHAMNGVVRSVDDPTILEYKALIGRHGFGCEPASAASLAGAHLLRQQGVIGGAETVVCILTGHQLKDPDATVGYHLGVPKADRSFDPRTAAAPARYANRPIRVADDHESILRAMR